MYFEEFVWPLLLVIQRRDTDCDTDNQAIVASHRPRFAPPDYHASKTSHFLSQVPYQNVKSPQLQANHVFHQKSHQLVLNSFVHRLHYSLIGLKDHPQSANLDDSLKLKQGVLLLGCVHHLAQSVLFSETNLGQSSFVWTFA